MKIVAIVPARSGSKSVVDKNLQEVQGISLLAWSVGISKMVDVAIPVFVDTDSPDYALEAQKSGATVPFLRHENLASDTSTDFETLKAFCSGLELSPDTIVLHLRPTTPLRSPNVVRRGVRTFVDGANAFTALRSVHENPTSPYKAFEMEPDKQLKPVAGLTRSMAESNLPRQSFPTTYLGNGYVDLFRVSNLTEYGTVHGPRVLGFVTEFALDADSEEELTQIRLASNQPEHRLVAQKLKPECGEDKY
jgi:N-acylneuraminate cytidylyltransferase